MNIREQEQKLKEAAYQSSLASGATLRGDTGCNMMAARPGLQERVANQLSHAQQEARRMERLIELSDLLYKHPDIARILDLVEEIRG